MSSRLRAARACGGILLLGDSYVESASVAAAENLGQHLQDHLNAAGSVAYEVISIGKSAWGQRDQLEPFANRDGPRAGSRVDALSLLERRGE